jgi:hypothetical protein
MAPGLCFIAFSSREPVSTSLENTQARSVFGRGATGPVPLAIQREPRFSDVSPESGLSSDVPVDFQNIGFEKARILREEKNIRPR